MNARTLSLACLPALLLLPASARADCPASPAGETILWSPTSGDDWLNAQICRSEAERRRVFDLVEEHMGLDGVTLTWGTILSPTRQCRPDGWGGRLIDGGYAAELVGIARDNDTLAHAATLTARFEDGTPVTHWLSQYIDNFTSWEGHEYECLSDDDQFGDTSYIYAANPVGEFAVNLYHPWFFHQSAFSRAGTLVHEATHEVEGHVDDDDCAAGGSCDSAFPRINAQSMNVLFLAQAIDAYQREPDSRDLAIINFGQDVCGYLPLLTDAERFSLLVEAQGKLVSNFRTPPPQRSWPVAAFTAVAPAVYDVAQPNGAAGRAYLIDIVNQSRWPCARVCEESDFEFPAGPRACNETLQPDTNPGINAANRARCAALNARVAEGVTPQEHARLLQEAARMTRCTSGISEGARAGLCAAARAGAQDVGDVADAWPEPPFPVPGYDIGGANRDCQDTFCAEPGRVDRDAAAEACYEFVDPTGCMTLQCGSLAALAAAHGRDSDEYFQALVCRASRLGRGLPVAEADGCAAAYEQCLIDHRYRMLWTEQLAGDDCWSDSLPRPAEDPLFSRHRASVTEISVDEFVSADAEGPELLADGCFLAQIECEALQTVVALDVGRMLARPELEPQVDLPDVWGVAPDRFDQTVRTRLRALVEQVDGQGRLGPLAAEVRALAKSPEARVAMAEMVGLDRFFRIGGAHLGQALFSPEKRTRFAGANAEVDPNGPADVGMAAEEAALGAVAARLGDAEWADLRERAGALTPAAYALHVRALAAATTAAELLAAHDALRADLRALDR